VAGRFRSHRILACQLANLGKFAICTPYVMVRLSLVFVATVLGLLALLATPVIGACIVSGISIHCMPATTRLRRFEWDDPRPKPQRGDEPSDVRVRGVHLKSHRSLLRDAAARRSGRDHKTVEEAHQHALCSGLS
jgi:hypothetical protein